MKDIEYQRSLSLDAEFYSLVTELEVLGALADDVPEADASTKLSYLNDRLTDLSKKWEAIHDHLLRDGLNQERLSCRDEGRCDACSRLPYFEGAR